MTLFIFWAYSLIVTISYDQSTKGEKLIAYSQLVVDWTLVESIFRTKYFQERIQFLEDNGFMIYGAVVTGPTKELLRLQELEEIQGVQLGEITFWNW